MKAVENRRGQAGRPTARRWPLDATSGRAEDSGGEKRDRPAEEGSPGEPASKSDTHKDSYECSSDARFALRERWREAVLHGRTRNGSRLVAGDKLTGLCVANHLNIGDGRCDPSIPLIETKTDQSNGTVKNGLAALKAAGALRRGGDDGRGPRMFALVDPTLWAVPAAPSRKSNKKPNRATHCPIEPIDDRAIHCPNDYPNRATHCPEPGNPLPANKGTRGVALRRPLNKGDIYNGESVRSLDAPDGHRPEEEPPVIGPPPTDAEMEATLAYMAEREECFDWEDECGVDEIEGGWQ